jgi:hypothetical protein
MKKFICVLSFASMFNIAFSEGVGPLGVTTGLPTLLTSGPGVFDDKLEVLKEEAVMHLSAGEIVEGSEHLKMFLVRVKKEKKYSKLSDIEILEKFIDHN